MLDGWYCRSLANEKMSKRSSVEEPPPAEAGHEDSDSQESQDVEAAEGARGRSESGEAAGSISGNTNVVDYKAQYRYLKRKLKFLIYVSSSICL